MNLFNQKKFRWRTFLQTLKYYWAALLIFLLGVLISFFLFRFYQSWNVNQQQSEWRPWEVLITGLLLSALTSAYFLMLVNRRLLVEKEVLFRTEELGRMNQALQEEIRQRQLIGERLHYITQEAIDAIVALTNEGMITSWNSGAEKIFGYSEAEILEKPIRLILPGEENFLKEGYTKTVELKGRHKDGDLFPIEATCARWKAGDQYFDTVIIRNITERKAYETKLLTAVKEAQAANRAKSEFLTTISHELRTPLNAIIGFTQCLLMGIDGTINKRQAASLKKVEKSSFHLLTLIDDLLDLAKIEANKMELEISLADVVEAVQSSIDEIQPLADLKSLPIHLTVDRPEILIEMDKYRLRQVLLNLLGNAVKFTEKGHIAVKVIEHEQAVEIAISDTGIGLTKAEIAKVFKPFAQADSSITRKYGGTGLGLIISKRIVDLHKGKIQVESKKGKGSTFTILLPKHLVK